MDKRHFTVVIGSKEHGLYVSSKPSSAAKKAVSKLCASNKRKKVEFSLREITQGSKKKTYGPYLGEMKKLKTPIELKGRVIRHEIKVHLKKGKSSTIKTSKKMRGGGPIELTENQVIDELINKTENSNITSEKPEDIEKVLCINGKEGFIKCKLCGAISGTLRIIPHNFGCKYNQQNTREPIIKGNRNISSSFMDSSISVAILQREYGIVNNQTDKKIIYSYGAGPCVILCMHDITTQQAILAHIDSLTINPLDNFIAFLQADDNCNVYIIGGDDSSKLLINRILKELKRYNYKIKFAHVKDNNHKNSFGINCITGETYLNDSVIKNPLSDEENKRLSDFTKIARISSKLNRVIIE